MKRSRFKSFLYLMYCTFVVWQSVSQTEQETDKEKDKEAGRKGNS